MPWRGPEVEDEQPTLGNVVAEWIQTYCVVPDRDMRGRPFVLTEEQHWHLIWHYALTEDGKWQYPRGSQLVRPQKWGKGPFGAAITCAEAVGPVLFAGWDAQGEPVGKPWATPHIQITACSEEQTDNTWRALQPMIELGPLGQELIYDTGLTRINLPGGGLIEPVTASARSRLGQRVTFVVQDQTESWTKANHGHQLASNQRRGLAGMNGRFLETCNAPDPVEDSVASRTPQGESGVYINDVDGGPGSVRNKAERRRVLRRVYGDSVVDKGGWIDLDRIDAEIEAMLEHDASQAERWFLNRKIASEGSAFDIVQWKNLARPKVVTAGSVIVLGVDGARHDDAIAVVATEVESGYQWPVIILERPENAPDDYEHDLDLVDGAVSDLVENGKYIVWRVYCDDQYIGSLLEKWQNKLGSKRVVPWHTNRQRPIAWAVRRFEQAITSADLSHDGNPVYARHIANARKRMLTVLDDKQHQMHTLAKDHLKSPRKIDAAMAGVLSWEARYNAMQEGAVSLRPKPEQEKPKEPDTYRADHAPAMNTLVFAGTSAPDEMM